MRNVLYSGLLLSGLFAAAPALADEPWEQVSDQKGIVVDRRKVEGSKLKEFRGRGVVDAPLASLLSVFNDIDKGTEWMDSCSSSSLVEDRGERSKIAYNRTRAPWPVSDRDVVLSNTVTFDEREGVVRIEVTSVDHPNMPPVNGVVRMPSLRGHWYLWAEPDGKTRVEYQVHANPGGALPNWLVNYVSKELPFKTIQGLRAQVKRRSYPEFEKHLRGLPEYKAIEEHGRTAQR
jgi:hypothetical protein